MSNLNLYFLGSPRISRARGGEITLSNRKALGLLAYLAIESDKAHSRDTILGLLWPDLPTAAAQNNLRVIWSFLNRLLKEEDPTTHSFLLSTRLDLRFNPESDHWLDVAIFQHLLEQCRNHRHEDRENCRQCADRLEQAASVVRGEFLAGFSLGDCPAFDEWLFIQRERVYLQFTNVLGDLAGFHERQGNLVEAEGYVRRLLELDPLRESAQRQLMRLLFTSGKRSQALTQFESFRRLLADELGVAPALETITLAEQIRAGAAGQSAVARSNLPPSTSRYIGHRSEITELQNLFIEETGSLVTLTGPGGVGKTRLALQIGYGLVDRFPHGVWLVELAALKDALGVSSAIASALNILQDRGQTLLDTIRDFLRDKSLLLILDTCEHLLDVSTDLVQKLQKAAPGLAVLATSRSALQLENERVVRLQSLSTPPISRSMLYTPAGVLQYEAVQLFVARAVQASLGFRLTESNASAVVKISQHLDGIPLAIELAAAQVSVMPVESIAQRLDQRFRWLKSHSSSPLSRHQTLRHLLDWSHELLNAREASLFRRVGVFAGSWTLEAAEAVCLEENLCIDDLTGLVNQSLVVFGYDSTGMRYRMHETIWHYARHMLQASTDEPVIQARHARYYAQLIRRSVETKHREPLLAQLEVLELELENLRVAMEWAVQNDPGLALEMAIDLGQNLRFWELRGHFDEGRGWLQKVLAAEPEKALEARASVLLVAAELSSAVCDFEYGRTCVTDSRNIFAKVGDRQGEVDARLVSAELAILQGEYAELFEPVQQAMEVAKAISYKPGLAKAGRLLGEITNHQGAYDRAIEFLLPSVAIWRQLDNAYELAIALNTLAAAMMNKGEYAAASEVLQETAALNRELGYRRGVALALHNLAEAAMCLGDFARARELNSESLRIRRELGLRRGYAFSFENIALLAVHEDRWSQAVQLFAAAQALREAIGAPVYSFNQAGHDQALDDARSILGEVRFNLDWSKGLSLAIEQAIELALS